MTRVIGRFIRQLYFQTQALNNESVSPPRVTPSTDQGDENMDSLTINGRQGDLFVEDALTAFNGAQHRDRLSPKERAKKILHLAQSREWFDIDEIRWDFPEFCRSTIYRDIKKLVELGALKTTTTSHGQMKYRSVQ